MNTEVLVDALLVLLAGAIAGIEFFGETRHVANGKRRGLTPVGWIAVACIIATVGLGFAKDRLNARAVDAAQKDCLREQRKLVQPVVTPYLLDDSLGLKNDGPATVLITAINVEHSMVRVSPETDDWLVKLGLYDPH